MSAGPTVNPRSGLLVLERLTDGWLIAGSIIAIRRPQPQIRTPQLRSWWASVKRVRGGRAMAIHEDSLDWLERQGLRYVGFPTRQELLRALSAAHAHEPIPAGPHRRPRLRPAGDRRWQTADGRFTVTRVRISDEFIFEIRDTVRPAVIDVPGTLRQAERAVAQIAAFRPV